MGTLLLLFGFFGVCVTAVLLLIALIRKKPKRTLLFCFAAALAFTFVGNAMMDGEDTSGATDAAASSEPAAVSSVADTADDTQLICGKEVAEADVMNGPKTKVIGTRAYISMSEEELTDETLTEICKAVDGLDYNWFTVDCGNGKGLVFPGCMAAGGSFGDIDEYGGITNGEKMVTVTDNGYTLTDVEPEPEPEPKKKETPKEEKKPEADESETTVSYEAAVGILKLSVQQGFGDNYTFEYDDKSVTIGAWMDGVAAGAVFAKAGDEKNLKSWEDMVDSVTGTSKKFADQLAEFGYDDILVTINVVNDTNHENTLLTVFNGVVLYDCVKAE